MKILTVTKEEVSENMKDVLVRTELEFNKPVTYVTVRMKNGFTLRESTTCVDSANYSEEIGKQICLEKIEDKIWFLLGYNLQYVASAKNKGLALTRDIMLSDDYKERFKAEFIQLINRLTNLSNMCTDWDAGKLNFVPTGLRELYGEQISVMNEYLRILEKRAEIESIDI